MDKLVIKRLSGKAILPYMSDLAFLRIKIFHDYPYLYEGDLEHEKKYLQKYIDSSTSTLVLVFDNDKVVGVSTAIALKDETDETKAPFQKANLDINQFFYLGESVLLPSYRGQQIGKRFFQEREAAAREYGYSMTTFCAVERPKNDPKRPSDWHPLDHFWQNLGYVKHPELETFYSWLEIGDTEQTSKPMIFWLKHLEGTL